jgi:amyloid beta precursor protein binding protein 1
MSKDKYDRQTRLWGEGQILISSAHVLFLNSDATNCEILKNLILSGIKEVTIVDDKLISNNDIQNNFFINQNDLNNIRGEIVLKNLLELNPDVKGNFINENIKTFLLSSKLNENINLYQVIVSSNLNDELNEILYKISQEKNKILIIIKNNGLFNLVKLYENFHANMKLRLNEQPIRDFRLSCPWKELIDFSLNFDLINSDVIDHKNIPYFVVLVQSLIEFRKIKQNENSNPQNKEDKILFKNIINKFKKKNEYNENIEEAEKFYYYCNKENNNLITEKLKFIFDFIEDNNKNSFNDLLKKSSEVMKIFFIYMKCLKKYYEKYNSLPLCGNIPDMISSTKNFIELKKIYNNKANEDRKNLKNIIDEFLNENNFEDKENIKKLINKENIEKNDKIDIIDILNKNWPESSLFIYPDPKEEKNGKNLNIDDFDEDFQKNNFIIYLLFRAQEKFNLKYNRYPGDCENWKDDVNLLKSELDEEIKLINNFPFDVNSINNLNDYVFEFCRFGHSQLPPCVSIIGDIASQEIIKLITYQFETINNTIVYDGINVNLSTFKI